MGKHFIIPAILFILTATSCRWEIGDTPARRDPVSGEPHRNNGSEGSGTPAEKDTTIYTLGIEFPSSYDWRRDTAYGNVNCRIVLFANQKRIVEADAGPGTGLRPDPDMHRIWDGHLYSDSCTGDETVIYRDGTELFRYRGNEMICGFMVLDSLVHTLGQSRSGPGFSYRIDGKTVLADSGGRVVGDRYSNPSPSGTMYMDDGCVCFSFKGGDGLWYAVRDGSAARVATGSLDNVDDMRYIGGNLYICGSSRRQGNRPVLLHDGRETVLWDRDVNATGFCHILPSGGKTFIIEGHIRKDGKTECSLWENGMVRSYGTDYAGWWVSGGEYCSITLRAGGRLGTARTDNGHWSFQDELLMMDHRCVSYREGALLIAATPVRRELSPVLWKNGRSLALAINGYLAGISFAQSLEESVDCLGR